MEAGLLGEVPGSNGRDVSFPHLLVRSAVYQALRARERRELHAAAARGLVGRAALEHRAAAFTAPDAELADEAERYAFEDIAAGHLRRGAIELKMALSLTPQGRPDGLDCSRPPKPFLCLAMSPPPPPWSRSSTGSRTTPGCAM